VHLQLLLQLTQELLIRWLLAAGSSNSLCLHAEQVLHPLLPCCVSRYSCHLGAQLLLLARLQRYCMCQRSRRLQQGYQLIH
jgi:hypothetical protein